MPKVQVRTVAATDCILYERNSSMQAFHSWWTKPKGASALETFEVLTMILSALKWREKNGEIYLVTDTYGEEYIKKAGIGDCWDKIITDLDSIPQDIDPVRFWAAGKIWALKSFKAPVVSIDTDFIVWQSLELEKSRKKLSAVHSESLNSYVYPDFSEFIAFDNGYDWAVLPLNTAFVYFGDETLKNEYADAALRIMSTIIKGDTLRPMVFAEQRLLAMIAHKMDIKPGVFSSLEKLSSGEDERFTHLWGFKNKLRENQILKKEFEQKLKNRIINDFPHMKQIVNKLCQK